MAHKAWMDQCHAIADSYYPQAINYYNIQKQNFIQQITGAASEVELALWQKQFITRFTQLSQEITTNDIAKTKAFRETIVDDIQSLAVSTVDNSKSSNDIKQKIMASKGRTSLGTTSDQRAKYIKNYSKRIKDQFNIYINESATIKNELTKIYQKYYSNSNAVSSTSMSGMISLFKKAMISHVAQNGMHVNALLSDQNISGYINLFKGYNAEVVAETAGNQLLSELNHEWSAVQIGGSGGISDIGFAKVGSELKNIESILTNIEKSSQTLSISVPGVTIDPLVAYGAQVKSWVLPDSINLLKTNAKRSFFTVGQRTQLLNQLGLNTQGKNSWWHYNIIAVAKHLIQAIGAANVLYITGGNKYIWTADLISQFREANYYLSFYYRRDKGKFYYPPTPEVTWQQEVSGNYKRGKYGNKDNDKK